MCNVSGSVPRFVFIVGQGRMPRQGVCAPQGPVPAANFNEFSDQSLPLNKASNCLRSIPGSMMKVGVLRASLEYQLPRKQAGDGGNPTAFFLIE